MELGNVITDVPSSVLKEYGIIETWFTIHESIADILGITYFLIVAGNDFFLISVCSLGCVECRLF